MTPAQLDTLIDVEQARHSEDGKRRRGRRSRPQYDSPSDLLALSSMPLQ